MGEKSCCFIGNDLQDLFSGFIWKNSECEQLNHWMHTKIEDMITAHHVRHFISGVDLCIGILAAEIVLKMKSKYLITLECVIPYEEQAVRWPECSRNRYFSIIEHADKETMFQTHYTPDCISKRNRYMIDSSDYILAVSPDGPHNTMGDLYYARQKAIPVYFFEIP